MFNSEKVITHLVRISSNIKPVTPDSSKSLKHGWLKEGVFVQLDDADIEEKESAIQDILADRFIEANFPRDYIEDQINSIISNSFKLSPEKRTGFITDEIRKLPGELRNNVKEWTVLIPIDNLKIDNQILIGDVIFYPSGNTTNIHRIISLLEKILENNRFHSEEEKERILNQQLTVLEKSANGVLITFAEVKTKGIIEIAQMEAMKKIRMALNILRLYNFPNDITNRSYFGICGEVIRSNIRYTMRYESELPIAKLNPIIERTGFVIPFELTEKRLELMRNKGYSDLITFFKSQRQTDFQKRLLNTIYWYGEAINTQINFDTKEELKSESDFKHLQYFNANQKFLKLMVALESILLFDENEPVTNNVAERTAFLLADTYEERKEIKTIIKDFYKKRSSIIHHGKSSPSIAELNQFSWIVQATIFKLTELIPAIPLTEKKDLQQYFEKIKLS